MEASKEVTRWRELSVERKKEKEKNRPACIVVKEDGSHVMSHLKGSLYKRESVCVLVF